MCENKKQRKVPLWGKNFATDDFRTPNFVFPRHKKVGILFQVPTFLSLLKCCFCYASFVRFFQANFAIIFAVPDFRLAAFFQWMMFCLANLSSIF